MIRNQSFVKYAQLQRLGAVIATLLAAALLYSQSGRGQSAQPTTNTPLIISPSTRPKTATDANVAAQAKLSVMTSAVTSAPTLDSQTQAEQAWHLSRSANSPWQKALMATNSPDDWVLKAIIEHTDPDRKEQHLLQAYQHQPTNLLVNFHLLTHCIEKPSSNLCSLPFEQTLLVHDGNNVYTLMNLALYQAAAGNHTRALHYLQLSTSRPKGEDYAVKHLLAIDRSQQRHHIERTLNTVAENLTLAMTATVPDFRELFSLCDTLVASQGAQGSRVCQNLGQQLQTQSKNLLDQATGGVFRFRYASLPQDQTDVNIRQLHQQTRSDFEALQALDNLLDQYADSHIPDQAWEVFTSLYENRNQVAASWYLADYIIQSEQQYAILF